MKRLLSIGAVLLLVSCGRNPDPAFVSESGDLGDYLLEKVAGGERDPLSEDRLMTSWSSRVLTDHHESGEYLDDRQALQIATARTNFAFVDSLLTHELGPPSYPMRQEDGWRHTGWSDTNRHLAVWLIEAKDKCKIEIVTKASD